MSFFEVHKKHFGKNIESQALKFIRNQGLEKYKKLGWPNKRLEAWKYSNIKEDLFTSAEYNSSGESKEVSPSQLQMLLSNDFINVVFIDGVFSQKNSNISKLLSEVEIKTLFEALELGAVDGNIIDSIEDGKDAMSVACLNQGLYLRIKRDSEITKPIHLVFLNTKNMMALPRVLVEVGINSKVSILEGYYALESEASLVNGHVEISAGRNSNISYGRLQHENDLSTHLGKTVINLGQGSRLHSTVVSLGGLSARHELKIKLKEEFSSANVNGVYFATGNQVLDHQTNIEFLVKETSANQVYKGLIDDKAKATFNGRVFIAKDAQKVSSSQLNNNLLLSREAEANSKPQLEIYADDVKAGHGATIGELSLDELFYLQSRGIKKDQAKSIIAKGFIESVIMDHPCEKSRNWIMAALSRKEFRK